MTSCGNESMLTQYPWLSCRRLAASPSLDAVTSRSDVNYVFAAFETWWLEATTVDEFSDKIVEYQFVEMHKKVSGWQCQGHWITISMLKSVDQNN